ncbi:hypothetical protein [Stappia sp. ES.058]|uniref:VHL beta domain-containing protein n=1 Tax=Stappia sp. ES.058 TaxID=1881061 RepID=UPI00087D43AC|nr:hypothetical protein [Stappia sp. ES.058]SDU42075.1 von Hippel-Lindau disease tumour suppressor protein [Stappia sp. ES.058]
MPIRPLPDHRRAARLLLAAFTATALFLAPHAGTAETRIVSLKSSIEGVTVDSAKSDGTSLKEVGRGSGILFVEAGRENAAFSCDQALTIGLSDGRSLSKTYDLCAINYVVDVSAADLAAKRETATRVERKLVMIRTDDDTAIRDVAIGGTAVKVRRRSKARVFVEVDGDPENGGQIACRRSLRLVLADGRILQDDVDICGDWKVTVDTKAALAKGSARGVRQAVPSGSSPSSPPLAGGVRRPDTDLRGSTESDEKSARNRATDTGIQTDTRSDASDTAAAQASPDTPAMAATPLFEDRNWYVSRDGNDSLALVYGIRETDDRGFLARCRAGSGEIDFITQTTVDGLSPGGTASVTLAARDQTRSYTARGSSANTQSGQPDAVVSLSATDPIWTALIRGSTLAVSVEGDWAYRVSLSGSAGPVRQFQTACAEPRPEVVASAPRQPSGLSQDDPRGRPSCREEGFITSVASESPATLIFRNQRRRPVVVYWLDFNGERQSQARIPAGGEMVQPTLAGHPWLVTNPAGQCLGIYLPQGRSRVVTIAAGRAPAPLPEPDFVAPVAPAPLFPAPGNDLVDINYDCDSGAYLAVTIDNTRRVAIVRESGLSPVTLADRSRSADLYYVQRGYVLSGAGNRVTWKRPGAPPQSCRVFN